MLEETPWLRQAQAESQARRNVGILFDDNRLNDETAAAAAQAGRDAAGRRPVAVVPRRAAATTTSRSTSPPASAGCGTWASTDRRRPGRQVARPAGRLDRPAATATILQARRTRTRTTCLPTDRLVPLRPQLLPRGQGRRGASTREAVDYFLGQAPSTGSRWPTASRRATWPWP